MMKLMFCWMSLCKCLHFWRLILTLNKDFVILSASLKEIKHIHQKNRAITVQVKLDHVYR